MFSVPPWRPIVTNEHFWASRDEDYGGRDFVVLDPEGNLWSFGTYRGA